ncbi:MAG TPA: cation:proton antiporter, partial [Steroidobacteraceae bacterium]|nr:cation:proton antiporter [Steroidobacteraceae bacterium]
LGAAQVAACTLALGAAAWLLGQPLAAAFVIGFGLSLSSTPLVLQVLAERGQLKTHHGRAAFGILLFQDLAVLPVLTILPLVAPSAMKGDGPGALLLQLAKLAGVIAVVVVVGRVLIRPALRIIARTRVTEVFTAAALLIVIAVALLVDQAGLSMALGAFLAGVLLADSEFRHELEADIEPFKGLLLGLFFIAVGMTANLGLLATEPLRLLAITASFVTIKVLLIAWLGKRAGLPGDAPWRLGFTLPAGGEFAFVLFTLGARERIVDIEMADLLVLSVTLSMMIAPLLLLLYDSTLHGWLAPAPKRDFDPIEEQDTRVLIAGFGRFGQIVARVLRARRITFTALDVNQTHVDFVSRFGNKVYYGDASRLDLLRAAGAGRAETFVIAVDDVEASLRIAEILRVHFPHLKVFARARNRQHAFQLMDRGLRYIIRETYLSSLDMAEKVLEALGDSSSVAREAVRVFRRHDEATLVQQFDVKDDQQKLVASARESAEQLEKLFEADQATSLASQR